MRPVNPQLTRRGARRRAAIYRARAAQLLTAARTAGWLIQAVLDWLETFRKPGELFWIDSLEFRKLGLLVLACRRRRFALHETCMKNLAVRVAVAEREHDCRRHYQRGDDDGLWCV